MRTAATPAQPRRAAQRAAPGATQDAHEDERGDAGEEAARGRHDRGRERGESREPAFERARLGQLRQHGQVADLGFGEIGHEGRSVPPTPAAP